MRKASVRAAGGMLAILLAAQSFPGLARASTPDDPLYRYQWGLRAIHAPEAWRYSRGGGIRVAVVDSGVDYRNEDLAGKVVVAIGLHTVCQPHREACDDDDVQPWEGNHATRVAGIIAASTGNGEGIAGVAPESDIVSAVVGTDRELARAIRRAVDEGARVVNMSFVASAVPIVPVPIVPIEGPAGRDAGPVRLKRALAYAWRQGAVLVAGAGNSSLPLCYYPALDEHTICVGATDRRNLRAVYSDFGVDLSVVAPGGSEGISKCEGDFSLKPEEERIVSTGGTYCGVEGYGADMGTSFAAPHVSGVAALLLSMGLTNEEVVSCIERTADDLGAPGYDPIYGHGLVNAFRAVREC